MSKPVISAHRVHMLINDSNLSQKFTEIGTTNTHAEEFQHVKEWISAGGRVFLYRAYRRLAATASAARRTNTSSDRIHMLFKTRRSPDFLWGCTFLPPKVDPF